MNLSAAKAATGAFLESNAATLLTGTGVVGVVTGLPLAWRAGYKTAMTRVDMIVQQSEDENLIADISNTDLAKETWKVNAPVIVLGGLTVTSIVAANIVSARKAAALAAAYALADGRLTEYKDKVAETLTGPKNKKVHDEIQQDRVTKNPPRDNEVIIIASGEVLCMDSISGRYFHSTVEQIRKAEHKINTDLVNTQYASLSDFYDEIGLKPTSLSDTIGWNGLHQDVPFELQLTTTTTPDQKPCIVIDYSIMPTPEYYRTH